MTKLCIYSLKTLKFQIFIQTNHLPTFSSMDGGVYRRPKVQEFPCKFVEKPILRYHKKADPNIKEYVQQFMLLLIEIYHNKIEKFREDKCFPIPDDVDAITKKYLEECDIVSCFVKDNYDQTGQQAPEISGF